MNEVNEKEYVLYIKKKCPYCVKAVQLLKEKNINFRIISFDNRPKVLAELKDIYRWKTVPMIFERLNENSFKLIGGYTDLLSDLSGDL